MTLRARLSSIKSRLHDGEDDLDESIRVDDLTLEVYVYMDRVFFEIRDVNDPWRTEVTRVSRTVNTVFDTTLLPYPQAGSVMRSLETAELE